MFLKTKQEKDNFRLNIRIKVGFNARISQFKHFPPIKNIIWI